MEARREWAQSSERWACTSRRTTVGRWIGERTNTNNTGHCLGRHIAGFWVLAVQVDDPAQERFACEYQQNTHADANERETADHRRPAPISLEGDWVSRNMLESLVSFRTFAARCRRITGASSIASQGLEHKPPNNGTIYWTIGRPNGPGSGFDSAVFVRYQIIYQCRRIPHNRTSEEAAKESTDKICLYVLGQSTWKNDPESHPKKIGGDAQQADKLRDLELFLDPWQPKVYNVLNRLMTVAPRLMVTTLRPLYQVGQLRVSPGY
ncbi:uncharacterized protein BO97DRAFT_425890 [Aspergillus homomorphus CBS 101889]|uniref:Uncharacterized protein n=1 Tax=Aspergillus homomorphus (strain CBS 101889) TaxID=1450537 RepID=A0A395HU70_ASPHC|nr:hypothetical protein BO97DRAFT_425890 [Aspergillus homomorphus CBS 101889]RAL10935.1 hypothetical protein BO97DRAFT_425890 [Aspergillus homomorphus CBS 101889]